MPYFPVDDDMAFHPKVLAAGNEAIGMWTRAGALCKKYTTGGFVSTDTARSLGSKRTADKLVSVGLWIEVDGGYQFHDWKQQAGNYDAQEEKERAEKARESNAARQAAYRARHAKSNAVTGRGRNEESTKPPIPIPIDISSDEEISPPKAPRRGASGERIPEPFIVTAEMRAWAAEHTPGVDVDTATQAFVDYWRGVPGVRGRKLDWPATWRNRLRDIAPRSAARQLTRTEQNMAVVAEIAAAENQQRRELR